MDDRKASPISHRNDRRMVRLPGSYGVNQVSRPDHHPVQQATPRRVTCDTKGGQSDSPPGFRTSEWESCIRDATSLCCVETTRWVT